MRGAELFGKRPAEEPAIAVLAAKGLHEDGRQEQPLDEALFVGPVIQQTAAIWARDGHGESLGSLPTILRILTVPVLA